MRIYISTFKGLVFGINVSEQHIQILFAIWIIDISFGKPDDPTATERRINTKDRRKGPIR